MLGIKKIRLELYNPNFRECKSVRQGGLSSRGEVCLAVKISWSLKYKRGNLA